MSYEDEPVKILGIRYQLENSNTEKIVPSECPLNKKQCVVIIKGKWESCLFLRGVGTSNEDGFCVVRCGAKDDYNTVAFVNED